MNSINSRSTQAVQYFQTDINMNIQIEMMMNNSLMIQIEARLT